MQRTLAVENANIVYEECGAGVPMLLLHGSPDTGAMWSPLMDQLAERARCIAPDLPGFGGSTLPNDFSLSLDHMADFVRGLLDTLKITEPVVLTMTDFGAHYGLAFAVKYPERIRGLVISNTNFFRDYQWHSFARMYRTPLLGEFLIAASSKGTISKAMKKYAPALPESYLETSYNAGFGSPKVRKTILRMYRERNSRDFIGWDDQLVELLKTKPALVQWGDRDPFITPGFAERFGAREVHHFAEYSHWLPLEAPEAYAAKLLPWLATI